MIKAHCFTQEWINSFKQQKHLKRINPPILEKMIHALSLLQQLKAHYEFDYESSLNQSAHFILLDILFEKTDYPRLLAAPIQSEWIDSEEVLAVNVPSIESILGDKLTAFAPNTVGILYGKDKEQEIIKQLFDIGCLFDEAENVEEITLSFEKIGVKEIKYRELEIGLSDILDDIFTTSLLIAKRTKNTEEPDKTRFAELNIGIRRFEGFLIAENFKIEDAILAASKAAYLAQKIKINDHSALEKYYNQDITNLEISGELNFLNKLKKSRDKAAFFYWYKALNI